MPCNPAHSFILVQSSGQVSEAGISSKTYVCARIQTVGVKPPIIPMECNSKTECNTADEFTWIDLRTRRRHETGTNETTGRLAAHFPFTRHSLLSTGAWGLRD